MNDQLLQQQLLQAEVTPPPGVWDLLAAALEKQEQLPPVSQKLNSLEIEAPGEIWEQISHELDKKSGNQIQQYIVEGAEKNEPSLHWKETGSEIPDGQLQELLTEQEVKAPPALWNRIEEKLEHKTTNTVTAFFSSKKFYYQLAAAAVAGLILWGSYLQLTKETVSDNQPVAESQPGAKKPIPADTPPVPAPLITQLPKPVKRQSLVIKNNVDRIEPVSVVTPTEHSQSATPETVASLGHPHHSFTHTQTAGSFPEGTYLMLLDDKGELIRVSKKLIQMKCMEGKQEELQVELTAALQSGNCDSQIKKWQEKIAQSAVLSTGGYTIDLLEVIQTTEK